MICCVKSVRISSFFAPYFPTFGLNTDKKNTEYGHFSRNNALETCVNYVIEVQLKIFATYQLCHEVFYKQVDTMYAISFAFFLQV